MKAYVSNILSRSSPRNQTHNDEQDQDGRASWPLELPGLRRNTEDEVEVELSHQIQPRNGRRTEPLGTIRSCSSSGGSSVADERASVGSATAKQSNRDIRVAQMSTLIQDVSTERDASVKHRQCAVTDAATSPASLPLRAASPFKCDSHYGRVVITAAHRLPVNDGAYVVLYSISTEFSTGETATVTHRYSQFTAMHEAVLSYFRAEHIQFVANLPSLPPKSWWWSNQASKKFIRDRRAELQLYLDKLLGVPHATECPALRSFLLDPF